MQLRAQDIIARARFWKGLHTLPPTSRCVASPGPTRTPEDAVRRIADDMIDLAGGHGAAEEIDLLHRGWSPEALRKYGAAARDIANRAVVRRSQ